LEKTSAEKGKKNKEITLKAPLTLLLLHASY
jgi:hypothetical protein